MLDFSKLKLLSSNPKKLQEYAQFGLSIPLQKGADLQEVHGTDEEVIIHKALLAGENCLIEDTSLVVEGMDVGVNVKWLIQELHTNPLYHGRKATWKVLLGVVQNQKVFVTEGVIHGVIDNQTSNVPTFGFDAIFKPNSSNNTLEELNSMNLKTSFSARKKAIDNILNQRFLKILDVHSIPAWTGKYQS